MNESTREELIEKMVDREIAVMSIKDMERILGDQLTENYRMMEDHMIEHSYKTMFGELPQ